MNLLLSLANDKKKVVATRGISDAAPTVQTHEAEPAKQVAAKVLDPRRPADQDDREAERARLIKANAPASGDAAAAGDGAKVGGGFDLSKGPYVVKYGEGTKSEGSLRLERLENGKLMVHRDENTSLHELQHGRKRQAAMEKLNDLLAHVQDPGEKKALEYMHNVVRDLKPSHRSALAQNGHINPHDEDHRRHRGNHRGTMPSAPAPDSQSPPPRSAENSAVRKGRGGFGQPPLTQGNPFNIPGA